MSFCCYLFQLLTRKNKKYGAFHKKYPEDFCKFLSKLRIFFIIVVSYLLFVLVLLVGVCLSNVGCPVLIADCRVSLWLVLLFLVVGFWFLHGCLVLIPGFRVSVVKCWQ
jgi:hypothetical protein